MSGLFGNPPQSSLASILLMGLNPPKITIYKSTNGQFYFVLKGGNGEVQATSEMYPTYANAKRGAEDFKRNATLATIEN